MKLVRRFAMVVVLASAGAGWAAAAPLATVESCRALRKHGKAAEATGCFESLSRSGDADLRAEGLWGMGQFDGANEAFRVAVAQPNSKALWRVEWGMLLHERFNHAEAVDLFNEALKLEPGSARAYLGLALVSADGFNSKAGEYAAKAVMLDPKMVEAHELVANLALENAKPTEALAEADAALDISSEALEAMAIHAAVAVLADRQAEADVWLGKIRAVNPAYGEGYALVGYHLVLNRRYDDGVAYYRRAIEADPKLWSARSQLGINLMRLGQEKEPLKQLEMAYENGYKDAATVNSLRLLDSYKNFVTTTSTFTSSRGDTNTILRLRKNEAALLRPYFEPELHKAIGTYEKKYKMKLPGPVQLEVYPDHEDFAVRTMGMPGLGALGVTFGEVVAMDSPSGRKPGEFNWGATLWHEMSHVFILSATNHRVPRWFTEGLAVHEEGQARPEWSNRVTPEILAAIRDKKLLGIAGMDQGFIYPEYPAQVIVSYFEAGSMCDYIEQRWGDGKLLEMVHSFAALKTTPEVVQVNLQMTPKEFDAQYMVWLENKVGATAANYDTWRKGLKELAAAVKVGDNDAVVKAGPGVLKLYPEYVGEANAYEFLEGAQLVKGDKAGAVITLKAYERIGGESPEALTKLAALEAEMGQTKEAAATLDRVNYIYPESEGLHRELGKLWMEQKNYAGAVREFTAVLALKPLDTASAEFELAQAYFAAGEKEKAEESVLLALETAPGFRPAQRLLLEIKTGR